jgi:tartrate-resistant acid phosphatase type 5
MSFCFFTIGDWGRKTNNLINVAKSMDKLSQSYKPYFILSLGDNFYPNGVKDSNDPKWNELYTDIFTGKDLFCPWYSILGNHDYKLNPYAQIDYYLEKKDNRWTMPSRYYTFSYKFNKKTIQIVALDTVELSFLHTSLYLNSTQMDKFNINVDSSNIQLKWLIDTLSSSTADWLIVIGHYHMYSSSYYSNNTELISLLKHIFSKYNVDMYICGHCHILEHLYDSNINFIISGAGSMTSSYDKCFQSKFIYNTNGYTIHEINNNIMTIKFINEFSDIVYQFNILQKRNLDTQLV